MSGLDEWYTKERQRALEEAQADQEKIMAGECPKCGGAITKKLDPYAEDIASSAGYPAKAWHRIRCRCGYREDWALPTEPSNALAETPTR